MIGPRLGRCTLKKETQVLIAWDDGCTQEPVWIQWSSDKPIDAAWN
jgi:hypothetical protein